MLRLSRAAIVVVYTILAGVRAWAGDQQPLQFTNAWCLLTSGRPAEAAEAYRAAFSAARATVVTAMPVAHARALAHYAATLAELGRYEDALSLLNSAQMLACSRYLDAERQYYLCRIAARLGDWETAADYAEQCIRIDPDHVPLAFHFLALRLHAHRRYREAIDTWLDGLYGVPLEYAPAYLDAAMGFWKNIAPDQVERFYDTLTTLAANGPLTHPDALARVLAERVKLQSLYPDRFPAHDPMALLDPRVAGSALTGIVEQAWVVVATPQWAIVSTLLVDEPMEQMLNLALQHLARGRKGDANALLQALLDSRELLRSCNVRIDGWPIGQAVDALALAADEGANDEARLARLRGCASRIIAAIKRGTTPVGDLWYLFQVHKWRLMDAARNGDERRMLDAMEAMRSIASSSIYLPACAAAEGLLGAQSVTQVRAVFTRLLAAPHPMPNYRNWLIYGRWLRECITNSACEVDGTAEETITGILLDGLEHSYGCETQSLLPGSSMRRPELCADPLFNELAAQLARGNITAAQIKRLQQFIERYGVCIPAVPDQVPLIRDIMLWRQRVTGYRVGPSVTVTQH